MLFESRSLLVVASVVLLGARTSAAQTSGTYRLEGGSYTIVVEAAPGVLRVTEPNRVSEYRQVSPGVYQAYSEKTGGTFALRPGMGWRIPTGTLHSFFTRGEALDVLAWHPDSDFGPTHDHHPMVNRTMVDGVSASHIGEIRTTEV